MMPDSKHIHEYENYKKYIYIDMLMTQLGCVDIYAA